MNSVQADEAGDFSSPGETFLAGFEVFWRSLAIPQLWCSSSWFLLEGALEVVSMRVIVLARRLAWAVTWCMDMARLHKSCDGRALTCHRAVCCRRPSGARTCSRRSTNCT